VSKAARPRTIPLPWVANIPLGRVFVNPTDRRTVIKLSISHSLVERFTSNAEEGLVLRMTNALNDGRWLLIEATLHPLEDDEPEKRPKRGKRTPGPRLARL
jgi:hypothetical protein